uniref:ATP synthase complex subunit 8 n=1 Tax=Neoephemera projecta TaxID=2770074 RepID=A0A8K1RA12_9INSE|nr:ATP synthase F0 subunit 8 [Neoephemera projecta]
MPQMAPLSWLLLFILFSMIFMMFNILNYFCYSPSPQSTLNETTLTLNPPMNWMW